MKKYKKVVKLRPEIKNFIVIFIIIIIVFTLLNILNLLDKDFIDKCTKAGYSLEHCIKNR